MAQTYQIGGDDIQSENQAKSRIKDKQHLTFHNYNSTIIEENPEDESLEVPAQFKRSSVPK